MLINFTFCTECCKELTETEKHLFSALYTQYVKTKLPCVISDHDKDLNSFINLEKHNMLVSTEINEYILLKPNRFSKTGDTVIVCFGQEYE